MVISYCAVRIRVEVIWVVRLLQIKHLSTLTLTRKAERFCLLQKFSLGWRSGLNPGLVRLMKRELNPLNLLSRKTWPHQVWRSWTKGRQEWKDNEEGGMIQIEGPKGEAWILPEQWENWIQCLSQSCLPVTTHNNSKPVPSPNWAWVSGSNQEVVSEPRFGLECIWLFLWGWNTI